MSWAIWITGVPGCGKSALARAAAAILAQAGERVRVLELDEIRKTLTPHPTYSESERDVVYLALGCMAALLTEAGVHVIVDATAHRRRWRDRAREAIPRFAEVQLMCPPEVCREREQTRPRGQAPPGIYARAGQPGATVPGVDVPYEAALHPELVIDTSKEGVGAAALRVVELARRLGGDQLATATQAPAAWAIWITGRPGSGKSTVAKGVTEALVARGTAVTVLETSAMRQFLRGAELAAEGQEEIVCRALAYMAKLLTEAGVAVIIDATAPRRVWREAARALIPCFAEVQLVCPPEVCVERERASRWRLGAARGVREVVAAHAAVPDLSLDYEESHRAELVVHTHVHHLWNTVEQVLFLIQRLHRAEPRRPEQP